MEQFWSTLVGTGVEAIAIIVGAFLTYLIHKGSKMVHAYAEKHHLEILDQIATNAVNMAENTLFGKSGAEKRQFAVDKSLQFLDNKGLNLDEDEVISAIERAVTRLQNKNIG